MKSFRTDRGKRTSRCKLALFWRLHLDLGRQIFIPTSELDLYRLCACENKLGGPATRVGKVVDGRLCVEGVHYLCHYLCQTNHLHEENPTPMIFLILFLRFFLSYVVPIAPLIKVFLSNYRFHGPIGDEDMGWPAMDQRTPFILHV